MEKIGEISLFLNEAQDELTLNVSEYAGDRETQNAPIRLGWGDCLETDINFKCANGKINIGTVGALTVRFGTFPKRKLSIKERLLLAWKMLWT